jgi:PEP-CTERM motif
MKKLLFIAAGVAASTAAHAASVDLGGRFYPGMTSGYVDAIIQNSVATDGTGDSLGDLINFSTPPITPTFQVVTLNTPNYGVVTAEFTNLVSFDVTPAGEFFTLGGNFNGNGYGTLSVNLVNPGFGISSFGIFGNFTYTASSPVDPIGLPGGGGPVDPIRTPGGGVPSAAAAVPEPSTWAMMVIGFAGLGYAGYRRVREPRAA